MIKLYNKNSFSGLLRYILLCCTLLIVGGDIYGQVTKPFLPRKSKQAPAPYTNVGQYKLQGDFLMIGNVNQDYEKSSFNPTWDNKQILEFIDIDNDPTTVNSSMAELKLPAGSCSEVIYAGLYWIGSSETVSPVNVTVNGKNWQLFREKIKFKHSNKNNYIDITAEVMTNSSIDYRFFTGYADITNYVRENGEGNYYVANIANDLTTAYRDKLAGWGIVIVYRNTAMPWRNITVFDGMIDIIATAASQEFVISGFRTPTAGEFNVSMGYMAGEGDLIGVGDYMAIRNASNTNWIKLSHALNTVDNFFNASIFPNTYNRNPKLIDNTGIDIGKIELPNKNNAILQNNASSTKIQIGTNGDAYFLFNTVFAVDSYQTDIIAENKITSGAVDNGTVGPGQELVWDLTIRNAGNEAIGNGLIEIPIPPSLHYVSSSVDQTKDVKGTVTWTPPNGATSTDPSKVPGGKLVWKFDKDVPLADINKVLGKITYKLKVVDCMIVSTTANNCMKGLEFNGTVGGIGKVTGDNLNLPLVKIPGLCGDRDDDDFRLNFNVPACPGVVNGVKIYEEYCTVPANIIKRATIINDYPPGTKFYSVIPGTANYKQSEITSDFPSSSTGILYYAIAPGAAEDCYMKLSAIYKGVTSTPTVNNVSFCFGQPVVLNNQPSKAGLKLYYYDSATATSPLTSPPAPTTVGTHTYYVAEGEYINGADCIGPRKSFTITIFVLPSVTTVLGPIDLCVNMNYAVTINTENAVEHWIEYTLPSAPTVWKKHDANSFPNGQLSFKVGGILTFTNITKDLDKVTLRVAVRSANGCIGYSNPFPITVTDCGGIVNPMLLTPAGK
ncbi:DUF11 domain-containing protein [Myroides odoratimimus]|uniref:Ig-like domain-containing protein n=1 Tax=Myroides odoratimimus TaxID=76832 RepID=UPI000910174B|nr:DUF11 domain-containing protein [Myroides odoratimimus]MDM1442658.1 DUF11 domain-containing protein [Myroides odoratimimus]SHL89542.1 conserved repeat domain-containing protein [Myroides odoratimimus subsp. xuanwuensis]